MYIVDCAVAEPEFRPVDGAGTFLVRSRKPDVYTGVYFRWFPPEVATVHCRRMEQCQQQVKVSESTQREETVSKGSPGCLQKYSTL